MRLAGLGGTGLLGLGGITTGAAGAAGAAGAIDTGGCFQGRFFFFSGAGGKGSGLWGASGTAAPFARIGTGTELALLRDLDEILFEIGTSP